jgi:hypothetical protein
VLWYGGTEDCGNNQRLRCEVIVTRTVRYCPVGTVLLKIGDVRFVCVCSEVNL